jgi:acyl carrier protein
MQYANTEVLVCAAEVTLEVAKSFSEHTGNSIIDAVKSEVSTLHGVAPNVVILLEPKSIPKTTSGKIARQWVKNAYLKDTLSVLQQSSNLSLLSEDSSSSSRSNKAGGEVRTVSQVDMESKAAIDPTGVALASILDIMVEVVADVLQVNTAQIDRNVPLQHLGIDSLLGVQLIADLEQRFTVPIPEKLFMDADTSLATVAASLQNGGVIKPRPMLLKGWSVASHIGFQRALRLDEWDSEPVASQWISVNATLANIDDNSFKKDTVFSGKAPESEGDELGANRANTFFSLFVLVPFVLVLPCVLCFVLFNGTAAAICFTVVALVVAAVALMPSDGVKKTLRTSYANDLVSTFSHFFGFRLLLAGGIDTEKVTIFVSEFQDQHVYNSLVGSILHQLFHGFVAGIPLTLVVPASFLKLPVFGSLLDVLRCRGVASLDTELGKGQSVCVMSDKRSADISIPAPTYVRCALRYGAQLVPCYHEQRKDSGAAAAAAAAGSLFFGTFRCASMTCYVGVPIQCPLVENPSNELVFSYIEKVRGAVAELKSDLRKKQQP